MNKYLYFILSAVILISCSNNSVSFFPEKGSKGVNPDTHLVITFKSVPKAGNSGFVRIYDAETGSIVDSLDMSKPAGPVQSAPKNNADYTKVPYKYVPATATNANTKPGTPSGTACPTPDNYQLTIIGGFTDAFHFYPVIVHGNTATVYPHNNLLQYGKTYYVTVDKEAITTADNSFSGIKKGEWMFSTKEKGPERNSVRFVVNCDGTGDFNTVQGALDYVPENNPKKVTIYVKNGDYEEIVYFRNKKNLAIEGESRDGVRVHYKNNEIFNPHPVNVKTNEYPGTFPSRRAAFMADNVEDLIIKNITIATDFKGQAEGLLIMGEHVVLNNVHIIGSGDALQANGSVYLYKCIIDGDLDTVLGRGSLFFKKCTLSNTGGPFMWIRNTKGHHGNIFVDCLFKGAPKRGSYFARCPLNHGGGYPYSEAVMINCRIENINPEGWVSVEGNTENIHYWEYNSVDAETGRPVDVSKRHKASKQLTIEKDSQIIKNYSSPEWIFDGWNPEESI